MSVLDNMCRRVRQLDATVAHLRSQLEIERSNREAVS